MGWFYDVDHPTAAEHEGYVALVLDGGEITSEHSDQIRGRVVAWRFACGCGWMHPFTARVPDELAATTAPPKAIEASAYAVWRAHIRKDVPDLHQAWRDRPGTVDPREIEL